MRRSFTALPSAPSTHAMERRVGGTYCALSCIPQGENAYRCICNKTKKFCPLTCYAWQVSSLGYPAKQRRQGDGKGAAFPFWSDDAMLRDGLRSPVCRVTGQDRGHGAALDRAVSERSGESRSGGQARLTGLFGGLFCAKMRTGRNPLNDPFHRSIFTKL